MIAQVLQKQFACGWLQSLHAPNLILFLDEPETVFAGGAVNQQYAYVHPFVADEVRRVPQNAVDKFRLTPELIHFGHGHTQFGNGRRFDCRAARSSSGTRVRRRYNCSPKRISASRSSAYHSGGTSCISSPSTRCVRRFSRRSSQGPKDSRPVTRS